MIQEPNSIKGCIQSMMPDSVGVIRGRVTQVSPIRIQAVNDDKLILNENTVIVPRHLISYNATCNISGGTVNESSLTTRYDDHLHSHRYGDTGTAGAHRHSLATFSITGANIMINNSLKVDDVVYMLSFNGGKRYYILDREEET